MKAREVGDIDICRRANELVKQRGNDAVLHAAQMADRMLDKGDFCGSKVWRRILKAVEELLRTEAPVGMVKH